MSNRGTALARLRKSLRRHARDGWERAVFARPGDDAEPVIATGPGAGPPSEQAVRALLDAAGAAAAQGRVKQTLVIDARQRVRIDARHGHAKRVTLDEARVRKMMGGKDRALRPDASAPLLRVIGIMNADGTMSARSAKKYKQVNHFVELCRPVWERLVGPQAPSDAEPLHILDLGCGNGYLGFVLVDALGQAGVPNRLHGVDRRADFIEQCRTRAEALGHERSSFAVGSIDAVRLDDTPLAGRVDLVVALHACDTATDDALALAIRGGARSILAAPCCQRELAAQLRDDGDVDASAPVPALMRHSILRRSYAADLTDALRVELLDACGYHVDAIEFIGSEHTPKNLLLRAHRRQAGAAVLPERWSLERVSARCAALGVAPRLLEALRAVVGPETSPDR